MLFIAGKQVSIFRFWLLFLGSRRGCVGQRGRYGTSGGFLCQSRYIVFKAGRISDSDIGESGCWVLGWAFMSEYEDNPDVDWR